MSIASAITALQGRIANAYTAIENKGGTLPATQDTANLATAIEDIPSGGSGQPMWGITELSDVCYTGSNGITKMMGGVTRNLVFTGVKRIADYGMTYGFYGAPAASASFPDLFYVGNYALESTFENALLTNAAISFPKIGYLNGAASFSKAFKNSRISSVEFPVLSSGLNTATFDSAFENCTFLKSASFPELTDGNVSNNGTNYQFNHAFKGCTSLTSVSFPKFVRTGDAGVPAWGKYFFNEAFQNCTSLLSVSFPALESLGDCAMNGAFKGCTSLSSISFPELLNATASAFYGAFQNTNVKSVSFPKLSSVNTASFSEAFKGCTSLSSASFPELSAIGNQSFQNTFENCTSLSSVSFPALKIIGGGADPLRACFSGTAVTELSFPELSGIYNAVTWGSNGIFMNNATITKVYFPKLVDISDNGNAGVAGKNLFNGCTNLVEIHFAAENQAIIESAPYYATKWAAPNANCQVYFDL